MHVSSSDLRDGMASSEEKHPELGCRITVGLIYITLKLRGQTVLKVLASQGLEISECHSTAGWEAQ
jgi:hypothetical protein